MSWVFFTSSKVPVLEAQAPVWECGALSFWEVKSTAGGSWSQKGLRGVFIKAWTWPHSALTSWDTRSCSYMYPWKNKEGNEVCHNCTLLEMKGYAGLVYSNSHHLNWIKYKKTRDLEPCFTLWRPNLGHVKPKDWEDVRVHFPDGRRVERKECPQAFSTYSPPLLNASSLILLPGWWGSFRTGLSTSVLLSPQTVSQVARAFLWKCKLSCVTSCIKLSSGFPLQ